MNEKYLPINSHVWIKSPVCSAVGRGHPRCSLEGRSTLLEEAFVSLLPCPSARLISTSCLSLNVISQLLAQAAYSNDSPAMMDSPSGYHKLLSYKLLFVTVFYHHSRKVPDTMTNGVVYTLHLPWGRRFRCSSICVRCIPASITNLKSIDYAVLLQSGAVLTNKVFQLLTIISGLCRITIQYLHITLLK